MKTVRPMHEEALAAELVRQPPHRHEQDREDDVVGVDDPGHRRHVGGQVSPAAPGSRCSRSRRRAATSPRRPSSRRRSATCSRRGTRRAGSGAPSLRSRSLRAVLRVAAVVAERLRRRRRRRARRCPRRRSRSGCRRRRTSSSPRWRSGRSAPSGPNSGSVPPATASAATDMSVSSPGLLVGDVVVARDVVLGLLVVVVEAALDLLAVGDHQEAVVAHDDQLRRSR